VVIKQTTYTDKDLDKLTGREKEQDILASQVISKFNLNSERILNTTHDARERPTNAYKRTEAVKKTKPRAEDVTM